MLKLSDRLESEGSDELVNFNIQRKHDKERKSVCIASMTKMSRWSRGQVEGTAVWVGQRLGWETIEHERNSGSYLTQSSLTVSSSSSATGRRRGLDGDCWQERGQDRRPGLLITPLRCQDTVIDIQRTAISSLRIKERKLSKKERLETREWCKKVAAYAATSAVGQGDSRKASTRASARLWLRDSREAENRSTHPLSN